MHANRSGVAGEARPRRSRARRSDPSPAQSPVRAAGHDIAVTICGTAGRRGQIPVENGKLDEPVEQLKRLVVGDVLLGLRRQDVRVAADGSYCRT